MSAQDNSIANEAARLEAENADLRAKLEAAERERDEARQIISLSKGLRNDSNPIYAEVKQLREQRDALAAALVKENWSMPETEPTATPLCRKSQNGSGAE